MRRGLLSAYAALAFAFLYAPIALLVLFSFNAGSSAMRWEGLSFRWHASAWGNPALQRAFENSVLVACIASIGSVILGGLFVLASGSRPQSRRSALALLPLIIPEIVLATALLILFGKVVRPALAAIGFELGTAPVVIVGHLTFCVSYVIVLCRARMRSLDRLQEEAARNLGANPLQVFFRVQLPHLAPALTSGFLLSFTASLDDFYLSHFLSFGGSGFSTLPTYLFGLQARSALTPEMNAIAAWMIAGSLLLLGTAAILSAKSFTSREPPR